MNKVHLHVTTWENLRNIKEAPDEYMHDHSQTLMTKQHTGHTYMA